MIDERIVLQKLYRLQEVVKNGHFIPGNEHDLGVCRWYVRQWIEDIEAGIPAADGELRGIMEDCNRMWKDYK